LADALSDARQVKARLTLVGDFGVEKVAIVEVIPTVGHLAQLFTVEIWRRKVRQNSPSKTPLTWPHTAPTAQTITEAPLSRRDAICVRVALPQTRPPSAHRFLSAAWAEIFVVDCSGQRRMAS